MNVQLAVTEQQKKDAFSVRQQVFVIEQEVAAEEEYDAYDETALHVVVYDNDTPVAAGRTRAVDEEFAKMERVCVLNSYREKGVGQLIMNALEEAARHQGLQKAKLHAQTHAEGFYQKLGYQTVSDVFMEAGIAHVLMVKEL